MERDTGVEGLFRPGCEPRLFDRAQALALGHKRAFEPAKRFFRANSLLLRAALDVRFAGFEQAELAANPGSLGLHALHREPGLSFWLGLGWGQDDPEDVAPSWGACFELDPPLVDPFEADRGGLRSCCERIAGSDEEVELMRFEGHFELARWRDFEWLLAERDQRRALERFWIDALDRLVDGGLPAALHRFLQA